MENIYLWNCTFKSKTMTVKIDSAQLEILPYCIFRKKVSSLHNRYITHNKLYLTKPLLDDSDIYVTKTFS